MPTPDQHPPDALLLLAPGCAHCPGVLRGLAELLEQGRLGRLEAVNVVAHPEAAQAVGTRSVPWIRIGPFELEGAQTPGELAEWTQAAAEGGGMGRYLTHLLETQRLPKVLGMVEQDPDLLPELVQIAADLEAPMAARIGIGALFEELAERGRLTPAIPELAALTRAEAPQVRADACHYLALTRSPQARPHIEALLDDPDPQVREIAAESLPLIPEA